MFVTGQTARDAFRRRRLLAMAAFPSWVFGPVDNPPCMRQRPFRGWGEPLGQLAGAWQGVPRRVFAPQRGRSARGGRSDTGPAGRRIICPSSRSSRRSARNSLGSSAG
ncbi:hypothetical protein NITHO_5160017 [Nitrolancea hollandica Lb]|uniref:Uncharacterized protein n=1 Tax=Nitrolancea hollandica Lb TaxID=1129897 RepID=I4ELL1_9BACT|nr:hypothetical protein NITHO_5160017 [Nitrolancea hollandica Lb]